MHRRRPHVFVWLALILCISRSTSSAIIDRNANLLSDVWELRFGAAGLIASVDSDGDGFTNAQEALAGTDPLSAASFPETSLQATTSALTLSWSSLKGKSYAVEASSDLTSWSTSPATAGTGQTLTAASTLSNASRLFLRLVTSDVDTDGDGLTDWEELQTGFNPLRVYTEGIGSTSTTSPVTDFQRLRDLLATTTATLTIATLDGDIAENWPDPGLVVVRRTGKLDALTARISISGTATAGADYTTTTTTTVSLAMGQDEAYIQFTPIVDSASEATETITVTLLADPSYTLGSATVAALTLSDSTSDQPAAKAAARFLDQATYGATAAEVERVRTLGYAGWLDDQFTRTANLQLPIMQTWVGEIGTTAINNTAEYRMDAWWRHAMKSGDSADPLRQRIALALSEIMVVSDRMDALANTERGVADYYDTLARDAFGNFRQLLEDVTRHPAMGLYLSALRNRKANTAINRFPDENYAREVMQLFTIGLWLLNADGTPIISNGTAVGPTGEIIPAGQAIPTYGQNQIGVLARIFTGLSYSMRNPSATDTSVVAATGFWDSYTLSWYPMKMFDSEHDVATKSLSLPGHTTLTLPARTASNPNTGAAGDADLSAALDYLANHPNIGPFIGRQLIQRLVTSNPSPAYVGRIAAVWANDGQGVRGNLRAVIRAILLDGEARDPTQLTNSAHGMVREPYIRYAAMLRAFGAAPVDASAGGRYRGFAGFDGDFLQRPLSSPSVFNFFRPDYIPEGPAGAAGLVSPEMHITNGVTFITVPNRFSSSIGVTATGTSTVTAHQLNYTTQTDLTATTTIDESRWNTRFDETPWVTLATGDADVLVNALDRLLCHGSLSPASYRSITRAVRRLADPAGTTDAATRTARATSRFRVALHLVTLTPEFNVLK